MTPKTRNKTGKLTVVSYTEPSADDDVFVFLGLPIPPRPEESEPNKRARKTQVSDLAAITSVPSDSQPSEDDSDYEDRRSSSKKRKRKTTKRPRHTPKPRPRLDGILERLPVEIVYKVFALLHPLDLLHLARTSRVLRSHLLSKTSAKVWKDARDSISPSIPACPPDQSEPQWAWLWYTGECLGFNCRARKCLPVSWPLRLRLCLACSQNNLPSGYVTKATLKKRSPFRHEPNLFNLLRDGYDSWCKGLYRVTDVETLMAEWAMISTLSKDNQLNFRKQKELDMIKMDDLDRNLHERYLERQILELEEKLVNQESREDEIYSRLEDLGHHPDHVRHWLVWTSEEFKSKVHLTESRWKIILPRLENLVRQAKVWQSMDPRLSRDPPSGY